MKIYSRCYQRRVAERYTAGRMDGPWSCITENKLMFWVNIVAEGLIVKGLLSYMADQINEVGWLCNWSVGWGVCSLMAGWTSNLPLIVWFILYGFLFPQSTSAEKQNAPWASGVTIQLTQNWRTHYENISILNVVFHGQTCDNRKESLPSFTVMHCWNTIKNVKWTTLCS